MRAKVRNMRLSLHQELKGMAKEEEVALGGEFSFVLRAKSVREPESPVLRGKVVQNIYTNTMVE